MQSTGSVIRFYREGDAYGFLSNFSPHPIVVDGTPWPTSEHYFQAQKFSDQAHVAAIQRAQTPSEAKRLGQTRSAPLRPDWEAVKDDIMYKCLRAKFTQHPELRKELLASGEAKIVEHTANDRYWGDGGDGSGKNALGILLMRLREELKSIG